jgi:hypothetical protein
MCTFHTPPAIPVPPRDSTHLQRAARCVTRARVLAERVPRPITTLLCKQSRCLLCTDCPDHLSQGAASLAPCQGHFRPFHSVFVCVLLESIIRKSRPPVATKHILRRHQLQITYHLIFSSRQIISLLEFCPTPLFRISTNQVYERALPLIHFKDVSCFIQFI